jgi:hypothetical protein
VVVPAVYLLVFSDSDTAAQDAPAAKEVIS